MRSADDELIAIVGDEIVKRCKWDGAWLQGLEQAAASQLFKAMGGGQGS